MKQIKRVVLKDATKLTTNEMKSIRGGWSYEATSSTVCDATCYHSTGAIVGYTSIDCSKYGSDTVCGYRYDDNKVTAVCLLYGQEIAADLGCENIIYDLPTGKP